MSSVSESVKRAMFNGRVNGGKFRRGFWSVAELEKADVADKPDVPADAVKFHYSDGCIAFYITDKGAMVVNKNNRQSDATKAIIAMFKSANPKMVITESDKMAGATRAGGSGRDWDAVFTL